MFAPVSPALLAERLSCLDFETIHDHSESVNENNHSNRGKQAW
jgi:hypothetical protein